MNGQGKRKIRATRNSNTLDRGDKTTEFDE